MATSLHDTAVRGGWVCEAWEMAVLQQALEDVDGVSLVWGRERSSDDGILYLTDDQSFPTDPISTWNRCFEPGLELGQALYFDVKSGKPFRFNALYVIVVPWDLHHIHIIPGQIWWEVQCSRAAWDWILRQWAVKLDDVPAALRSLVAASKSTGETLSKLSGLGSSTVVPRWYKNPTNGVEFDGWWVPPPRDIAAFTHPKNLGDKHTWTSEQAIHRLYKILKDHPNLSLHDNPIKPMIADFVLRYKVPKTGSWQQVFIEHKAYQTLNVLTKWLSDDYNWHLLVVQSLLDGEDSFKVLSRRGQASALRSKANVVHGSDVVEELLRLTGSHGKGMQEALRDAWSHIYRTDLKEELDAEHRDDLDVDLINDPDMKFVAELQKAVIDKEDEEDEEEGANGELDAQGQNRMWRVKSDKVEAHTCSTLNDQSWFMGQHVVLHGSSLHSLCTSIFVEHSWTLEEKAAYETRRILPQVDLDANFVPLAFLCRLYASVTGERLYVHTTARKVHCSKIKPVFLGSDPVGNLESLDSMTLHCADPTSGECTKCSTQHRFMRWKDGQLDDALPSGPDTHPDVVAKIGKYLGKFGLNNGRLWLRLSDFFSEGKNYKLRDLLQSSWSHGLQRERFANQDPPPARRWAPCNTCWAEGRECDMATGACGPCSSRKVDCERKRCTFFAAPQACGVPSCTEVHSTDGYTQLTDVPRDINGKDKKAEELREAVLADRIPVCDHCWENGWYLLCSKAAVCHLCTLHNKGQCVRTMCDEPATCKRFHCYYAHRDTPGNCKDYKPRKIGQVQRLDLTPTDKATIAQQRDRALHTIDKNTAPYAFGDYGSYKRVTTSRVPRFGGLD